MPKIKIDEENINSLATFEVTDNVVLVPLMIKRSKYGDNKAAKQFSKASDFESAYKELVSQVKDTSTGTDTHNEKSYIMASSLLSMGLKVVIIPLEAKSDESYDSDDAMAQEVNKLLLSSYTSYLEQFESRNMFNIKFITSGAYYNYSDRKVSEGSDDEVPQCYTKLIDLAHIRGDAVALVELDTDSIVPTKNVTGKTYIGDITAPENF